MRYRNKKTTDIKGADKERRKVHGTRNVIKNFQAN